MIADNKISKERIKKALSYKTVAAVLAIAAMVSAVFYIMLENRDKKEVRIWYVTTEAENCFPGDTMQLCNEYAAQNGLDRVILTRHHPDDVYFDATMSTSAQYHCDVFIMNAEMAMKYADMEIFMPVSTDGREKDELLRIGEEAVGILIAENYYFLINTRTDIDLKMIYDILDIFTREK